MYPLFSDIFVSDYRSEIFHRGTVTPKRICEDYEIEFYKTDGGVSYVDGCEYLHKKGNILFARPGQLRYSKGSFECFAVHFGCEKEVAYELFSEIATCFYLPDAKQTFQEIVSLPTLHQKTFRLQFHSCIFRLLAQINQAYPSQEAAEDTSFENLMEINRICDFIKANFFEEGLSINQLYKNSFMSRSAFFKTFKTVTGLTPAAYINAVRTEHAKKLLCNTNKPLAYIAAECGFASQSYFCQVFKSRQNITPFEYRRAHIESGR